MWARGDVVVRREVLNDGRCWLHVPVHVVCDHDELLASYIARGARFTFPPGQWPTANGRHPWHERPAWEGNGVLMLQRPGEAYAVWCFWSGDGREFQGWYVNFQAPFRRTADGYDTQDLELDIWVPVDGPWQWKDLDVLDQRVAEGRLTADQVERVRADGERVAALLDAGQRWWDDAWASWAPDQGWDAT
jgi:hypothetical protein